MCARVVGDEKQQLVKRGVECFALGGKRQKGEKVADEEGEGGLLVKEKKADRIEVRV